MIVRRASNDELLLVAQTEHSRLVGRIAARWGGAHFDRPDPYESMVRAAAFHDFGWLRYETAPLRSAETGRPLGFLQVPNDGEQLDSFQWSLDWMDAIDPYAGLIVSMHRTGLWKGRYGAIRHPGAYNLAHPDAGIRRFIEHNEARQAERRARFDSHALWTNYCLMQVWDLLGLYFCCQEPAEEVVDSVPQRYAAGEEAGVLLRLTPEGACRVAMEPYPFDERPVHLEVVAQRLPRSSYPDLESFRAAYYRAHIELLRFEIV